MSVRIRMAFAPNGKQSVILREGPSRRTRMLVWDTGNDQLTPGQWIHSKVRHFAINSDGSLILCFVQSYRKKHNYGTWVALSKPPWFSALAVWQIGDSWGGACRFVTDRKIFVEQGTNPIQFSGSLAKGMEWTSDRSLRPPEDSWGWQRDALNHSLFIKRSETHALELHYSDFKYQLYSPMGRDITPIETPSHIDFADMDNQGRVVFTDKKGIIYRVTRKKEDIVVHQVFDLADMTPEPIKAPVAALRWK